MKSFSNSAIPDRAKLVLLLRERYKLDFTESIHGIRHWARVRLNGLILCRQNDANWRVVELFALLHDVAREHEEEDYNHGRLAVPFVMQLAQSGVIDLTPAELKQLCYAIHFHSDGKMSDDVTIQTCWDSDRLDLWRVQITPSPMYLSPLAGKHGIIIAAMKRSVHGVKVQYERQRAQQKKLWINHRTT